MRNWTPFDKASLQYLSRSNVGTMLTAAMLIIVAIAAIEFKASGDYRTALRDYRTASAQFSQRVAENIDAKLNQTFGGLRTISMLPSVRRLDRHGTNLDADSLASIQQLYNNLASNVEVSEVYIVPADFNPERIDPVTNALQAPIIMFDELIVNAGARTEAAHDSEADAEHADAPEVEIFEYRALAEQVRWLWAEAPTNANFRNLDPPMLSTPEVITCDNSVFIHTGADADRSGIILSVPFYDFDGRLKGTISAIVRTGALADYLPDADFALVNSAQNYLVFASGEGQALASHDYVRGNVVDPSLVFSTVIDVNRRDPQGAWRLWVGPPNVRFAGSASARNVGAFRLGAYASLLLLTLLGVNIFTSASRRYRAQRAHEEELERLVGELRTLAKEQAALRAFADEANAAKSQFLANMSHELRTPLNAIMNYSEVVLEEAEAAARDDMVDDLKVVLASSRHLLSLIDTILNLAKIEAGRVDLDVHDIDVRRLIEQAIDTIRPAADAKGLALLLEAPPSLGYARSDALKLMQCLLNLLSNAAKFTERGGITMRARRLKAGDGEQVVFEVTDTGNGIAPDQLDRVFQPFEQADSTITRKFGGTGLGLTITRTTARLLGGEVTVRSKLGEGSTFTLHIPVDKRARGAWQPRSPQDRRRTRPLIVLIDDQVGTRDLTKRAFEQVGFAVCDAATADDGLNLIDHRVSDLVCLDLDLPDGSGWSLLEELSNRDAPPPLITVSGRDDHVRAKQFGACAHFVKPIAPEELAATALRFARDCPEQAPEACAPQASLGRARA